MAEGHTLESLAAAEFERTCTSVPHPRDETVEQVRRLPVVVTAGDLLKAEFPPVEILLTPWFESQSINMLYAQRGVGKTHVAMGVAHALATGGSFLAWKATRPVSVLYVDGEMAGASLQKRYRRILESQGGDAAGRLKFMTPDLQQDGVMPNLFNTAGQSDITDAATDSELVIIDNISALVRGGKENEGESWQPVAEWALSMRANGKSVLFVHHAGKTGQQRGTSKREDLLNTVIALRRPADYTPEQGARFEIHFEKGRELKGDDVAPMEAALTTGIDGRQVWNVRTAADSIDAQLLELMGLDMSQGEAATELGVSRGTVIRHLRRLQGEGRYKPKPKAGGRPRKEGNVVELRPKKCPRCDGEGCEHC